VTVKKLSGHCGAVLQCFAERGVDPVLPQRQQGRGLTGELDALGDVRHFAVENPLCSIEVAVTACWRCDEAVGHQRRPDDPAESDGGDQRQQDGGGELDAIEVRKRSWRSGFMPYR